MKLILRLTIYVLSFVLPVVIIGAVGFVSGSPVAMGQYVIPEVDFIYPSKDHDETKPTIAVLLGHPLTEVTDFLIPYELFSRTGAFNVYGVAVERHPTMLTGGLQVMPDLSLNELDTLLGKSPDMIVIPAIPSIHNANNQQLLAWLRHHGEQGSLLFSICTGAEVLAETGLLDGRTATTHWADIDNLRRQYPAVHFVDGMRYVDDGDIISSAGITSGIDAALHLISRLISAEMAQIVAHDIDYPTYEYVNNPQVDQYYVSPSDAIYVLNAAYNWQCSSAGVFLYDGVGELELASIFDTYAASYTTQLFGLGVNREIVTTRSGLQIIPQFSIVTAPAIERLLVPGHAASNNTLNTTGNPVVYLHSEAQFPFDAALIDLARQQNIPTAQMAAKRLEYRPNALLMNGSGWPLGLLLRPLGIGLVGVVSVMLFEWMRSRQKTAK